MAESVSVAGSGTPPPPPGYELIPPSAGNAIPPPPPGYEMVKPKSEGSQQGVLGHLKAAVTDIPHEIYEAGKSALTSINDNLNPLSDAANAATERRLQATREGGFLGGMSEGVKSGIDVGKGILGVPALAMSPITGAGRSVIGHALAAPGQISYEQGKEQADTAMMGLGAGRGPGVVKPAAVPPVPARGPLGVTLSEGQASGELPLIQREQAALRGQSGAPAHAHAQEFADQQTQQVTQAREDIAKTLDGPAGRIVAESPQEAGSLVSQGVQRTAAQAKTGVKQAYDTAKSHPGEIQASAFDDIGNAIKTDLSTRADPVIIDDALTPYASRAIKDVEQRIEQLNIQNRASPTGQPPRQSIVGVNLEGVDQMRKRLSAMRRDAYGSGNAADGRATKAVLDAFDDHIERAINGGMFNGDPRAVQAWNTARAAYADYRSTFTAGKNDPVGRVVEKIIGKGANPAAIPNDVADFMYGSSGVNPSSLHVGVANRIKGILGDQSPEWSAVKQGLFSRLVETPQGVTDFGPGKTAQRLAKFLNGDGKELAEAVFSAPERTLLWRYSELMRQMQVPQAGANWSNTAAFLAPIVQKIGSATGTKVAAAIGGMVGHLTGGVPYVGEAVGATLGAGIAQVTGKIGQAAQMRQIARQMPIVAQQVQQWQRATARATLIATPPAQAAATVATNNLARSLGAMGIDFRALQGPSAGPLADPATNKADAAPQGTGERNSPVRLDGPDDVHHRSEITAEPTPAQAAANNYKHRHVRWKGMDISVESETGHERAGIGADGQPWSTVMSHPYGYLKKVTGADSENVDVYIGPHPHVRSVFVFDQASPEKNGAFDEHKIVIGARDAAEAEGIYDSGFSDGSGPQRRASVKELSIPQLKQWLADGDLKKPLSYQPPAPPEKPVPTFQDLLDDPRSAQEIRDGMQVG